MTLDNIKTILSLTEDDSQDEILAILLSNAMNTICIYIGVDTFPEELGFVAEQLTVIKYRKLGSEGISSEKLDVISVTYQSDELSQFKNILNQYQRNALGKKRFRML